MHLRFGIKCVTIVVAVTIVIILSDIFSEIPIATNTLGTIDHFSSS